MRVIFSINGIIIQVALLIGIALFVSDKAIAARYVLTIGINKYDNITSLQKAVGDAKAVGATMAQYGYTVIRILNPNRRQFNAGISRLVAKIKPGDTVVVHYSGHGVDISGQNYLLPADIPLPRFGVGSRDLVKNEAIRLQNLIERISNAGASARIVIVDACRNNPFAQGGTRGVGKKAGLAPIDHAPAGTFIMYSAGVGQLALDRLGDNDREPTSVFTRIFLRHVGKKGQSIQALASQVRRDVLELAEAQSHLQRPAIYDNLLNSDRFSLRDGGVIKRTNRPQNSAAPSATRQPALPGPALLADTKPAASQNEGVNSGQAFQMARDIDTIEAWQAFLEDFPTAGFRSRMARARLKKYQAERDKAANKRREDKAQARSNRQREQANLRAERQRQRDEQARQSAQQRRDTTRRDTTRRDTTRRDTTRRDAVRRDAVRRRAAQRLQAKKARPKPRPKSRPKSRSGGASCGSLWYARNAIYARAGYCFKSSRGRRTFGNNCRPPYGKLTSANKRRVNAIRKKERRQRCSK
ncbi:MAG: caspase family protein [Hyphomicrobiaceae bacterium]|nr:caspase family protein [Hyphomicrobiaceae bacterium]